MSHTYVCSGFLWYGVEKFAAAASGRWSALTGCLVAKVHVFCLYQGIQFAKLPASPGMLPKVLTAPCAATPGVVPRPPADRRTTSFSMPSACCVSLRLNLRFQASPALRCLSQGDGTFWSCLCPVASKLLMLQLPDLIVCNPGASQTQ